MPLLEVSNLSKRYPGVVALKGLDFTAEAGEVHAIVGANGAGKSTLMKLLSGATRPTGGEIRIADEALQPGSPHAAQAAGIATVYQEFSLVPQLSVARNIFLGHEPRSRWGGVESAQLMARTKELLEQFSIRLDPAAEVSSLSVAEQQMVEIARALSLSARILILDEPTAVLSLKEQENLFAIMRRLRADGMLILYVSHRLQEVLAIANRVTVMRDGQKVDTRTMEGLGVTDLIEMMIGRRAGPSTARPPLGSGRDFAIEYRSDRGISHLALQEGEILGIAGLVGAGRTTFGRALAGRSGKTAEVSLSIAGRKLALSSPRDAMRAGVVYLTEDRKRDGLFAGLSIVGNATATALPRLSLAGLRRHRHERETAAAILERLRLVAANLDMSIAKLSGGNQQKVVIGRALLISPRLLICDEPTRGVDVGAKAEIHDILRELAGAGTAIVVISSEIEELLALSHRVAVMADHRIVAEMPASGTDEADILLAASDASEGTNR